MEEKVDERMTRKTAMKMLIVIMDAIIGKSVGIAKRKIYRVAPRMTRTIIITVAGSIRGEIVNVDIKNATEKRMSAHQNRTSVTLRALQGIGVGGGMMIIDTKGIVRNRKITTMSAASKTMRVIRSRRRDVKRRNQQQATNNNDCAVCIRHTCPFHVILRWTFQVRNIKHTFSSYQIHVDIVLYCIMITHLPPSTQSDQERREVGEIGNRMEFIWRDGLSRHIKQFPAK